MSGPDKPNAEHEPPAELETVSVDYLHKVLPYSEASIRRHIEGGTLPRPVRLVERGMRLWRKVDIDECARKLLEHDSPPETPRKNRRSKT